MQKFNQFILNNLSIIFLILFALFLIMTANFILASFRYKKVTKRYNALMRGLNNVNLEQIIFKQSNIIETALTRVDDLEMQYKKLHKIADNSLQHLGFVRFNAFENTGSDLSFAIALLDAHMDGLILSSIFSRHDSRIYAKPVKNGASNYNLSDEEQTALNEALNKS